MAVGTTWGSLTEEYELILELKHFVGRATSNLTVGCEREKDFNTSLKHWHSSAASLSRVFDYNILLNQMKNRHCLSFSIAYIF